jgi:ElaB/YqjD/DUF883 family membrane-anchored ribosome-binding protein
MKFAELGDYSLGMFETSELQHEVLHEFTAGRPSTNIPLRDFFPALERHIGNYDVCLFIYGQKQPVSLYSAEIVDLSGIGKVEVALAVEYELPGQFITAKDDPATKLWQYSNWLSNMSVNVEVTNPASANDLVQGAYRVCVYNTIQHEKRQIDMSLHSAAQNQADLLTEYKTKAFQSLDAVRRLHLGNTKLRYEVYFELRSPQHFERAMTRLGRIPPWLKLCMCPVVALQEFVCFNVDNLKYLWDFVLTNPMEPLLIFTLLIYGKFVCAVHSLQKMNKKFKEKNFGMAFPESFFTFAQNNQLEFQDHFYQFYSATHLFELLTFCFGDRSMLPMLYFFGLLLEQSQTITSKAQKTFFSKITSYFVAESNVEDRRVHEAVRTVSRYQFFDLYKERCAANIMKASILDQISRLPEGRLNALTMKLIDSKISFVFDRTKYYLGHESAEAPSLTWEDVKNFARQEIDDINNASTETLRFQRKLSDAFKTFFERRQAELLEPAVEYTADMDYLMRCVCARVPSDDQGSDLHSITVLFDGLSIFLKFVYFGYLQIKLDSIDERFRRRRDNINPAIKKIDDYKLSVTKLLYCTGCFPIAGSNHVSGRVEFPTTHRIKLGQSFEAGQRLRLATNRQIMSTRANGNLARYSGYNGVYVAPTHQNAQIDQIAQDEVTQRFITQISDDEPDQVHDQIDDQVTQISDQIDDQVAQISDQIDDQVAQISDQIDDQVTQISDQIDDQVTQISDQMTDLGGATHDQITEDGHSVEHRTENMPSAEESSSFIEFSRRLSFPDLIDGDLPDLPVIPQKREHPSSALHEIFLSLNSTMNMADELGDLGLDYADFASSAIDQTSNSLATVLSKDLRTSKMIATQIQRALLRKGISIE